MLESVITEGTGLFLSFTPQSGTKNTDVRITLPEIGPFPPNKVTFNGKLATFRVLDDGDILAQVPDQAGTGKIVVSFQFGTPISSLTNFTYVDNPTSTAPTITGFSPLSGGLMTNITVNGSNLGLVNMATIGGQQARVLSVFANSVRLEVTNSASGPIQLSGEGFSVSSTQSFTFQFSGGGTVSVPQISSFSPTSGPTGTDVTILGANFGTSPAVSFGGVAATVISATPSQIIAKVPQFAMTGKIGVSTAAGTTFSLPNFTITTTGTTPPPTVSVPVIESFSPSSGPKGSDVFITGRNLTGTFRVVFGTGISQDVTVLSDTTVRAKVPDNATTGQIILAAPTGSARSATSFTVSSVVIAPPPTPTTTTRAIAVSASGSNVTLPTTGNEERPNFVPFDSFSGRLEITQGQTFDLNLVAYRLDGQRDTVQIFTPNLPGQPMLAFNPNPVQTDEQFTATITVPVIARPKDYLILIRGEGRNFADKDYGPYTLTVTVLPAIELDYVKEVTLEGEQEKIITVMVKRRIDIGRLDFEVINSGPQELSATLDFKETRPLSVLGGNLDRYELRLMLKPGATGTQFTVRPSVVGLLTYQPEGDGPIQVNVVRDPKLSLSPTTSVGYVGETFKMVALVNPNSVTGQFRLDALAPVGVAPTRSVIPAPKNTPVTFNSDGSTPFDTTFEYPIPRTQQPGKVDLTVKLTYTKPNGSKVTVSQLQKLNIILPPIYFNPDPGSYTFRQGDVGEISIGFVRAGSVNAAVEIFAPDNLDPRLSITPSSIVVPPGQNAAVFKVTATPQAKGIPIRVVFYTLQDFVRFERPLLITAL